MGDLSSTSEIFCKGTSDGGFGLRYRGIQSVAIAKKHPSPFVYSDETCLSAAIEYVSDGNGNETIPVFVTKAGNKVYIPPSIADLLRDKPPDHTSGGSECEDEESSGGGADRCSSLVRIEGVSDGEDSESDESGKVIKIGRRRGNKKSPDDDNTNDSDEELGGIQVVSCRMRKVSKSVLNGGGSSGVVDDDFDDVFNTAWFTALFEQFKHVGPKLVPFLKTLGLYFVIFIPDDRPSLFAMMIKCLPIISLALFIVLHGIGLSEEHKFSRRILIGLIFSCLGDAFLIWPSYFLHGMAAFGVAQCFYIGAFGFQPMNWKLGLLVYTLTSSSLVLILPGLLSDAMPVMIGVLVYSLLLTTMLWRAIDRVDMFSETSFNWNKLPSCVGGIFFAISDTILALNQFYARIPYHQTLVMATYYLAQLGIALSVVSTTKESAPKSETITNSNLAATPIDNLLGSPSSGNVRHRKGKSVI